MINYLLAAWRSPVLEISELAPLRDAARALAEAPYLLPGLGWLWRADSHSELTRVALHVILLHCMSFLSDNQLSCTFFS